MKPFVLLCRNILKTWQTKMLTIAAHNIFMFWYADKNKHSDFLFILPEHVEAWAPKIKRRWKWK